MRVSRRKTVGGGRTLRPEGWLPVPPTTPPGAGLPFGRGDTLTVWPGILNLARAATPNSKCSCERRAGNERHRH